jgi:predicted esterase YcpF (UPF0227 family)
MQNSLIIYIHGFGSSGFSSKARELKEYFEGREDVKIFSPSLSYVPELAIDTLEQTIELFEGRVGLVGSSLGGYYSLFLSQRYNLKTVLINPSINPTTTIKPNSKTPNYYDLSYFEFNQRHLEMLKKYQVESINGKNILLMLQSGDEVLDFKVALEKIPDAELILEEGGDHSFQGFERYLSRVEEFLLG